jgi:hypothetical protein
MKQQPGFAVLLTLVAACLGNSAPAVAKILVSDSERSAYIESGTVWEPGEVASRNIMVGPPGTLGLDWGDTVECTFVEPEAMEDDPLGGYTPKFRCRLDSGREVKVKYGIDNGEVYAEAAASRLLWALGFPTDRIYPVRVVCRNCPAEPWTYIELGGRSELSLNRFDRERLREASPRAERIFIPAVVEEKLDGETIESEGREGWSFREMLDYAQVSAEQRVHRDALVLLMAMLQHADSKIDNQRLVCPRAAVYEEGGARRCRRAVLAVHDLGWTFGGGFELSLDIPKMNLDVWRDSSTWEDRRRCVVNVRPAPGGTLSDQRIGNEGRLFLLRRLQQLSRRQIEDLFRVSRVILTQPMRPGGIPDDLIYAWADVFAAKVADIASAPCDR